MHTMPMGYPPTARPRGTWSKRSGDTTPSKYPWAIWRSESEVPGIIRHGGGEREADAHGGLLLRLRHQLRSFLDQPIRVTGALHVWVGGLEHSQRVRLVEPDVQ